MLKGTPSQTLAITTASSDRCGSDSQKMCDGRPSARSTALSTPISPAKIHFQIAPTTSPGMIQPASSRPRIVVEPGKRRAKNDASASPIGNCSPTENTTNTIVLRAISSEASLRNAAR